ncbi:MAG TPA: EamA family transporter [Woeseiaceae bacterium]|jgi:drug/metabolite transporter (DMT)-like permease|nr:EamA family transporter [Woeseiaceae bacterium]
MQRNNLYLYLLTVAIWGSTWLAIEFQLGVVAPEVSVFYRYALASALLFGFCRARGLRLAFNRRAHGRFALLGLLLFCLNYILTYYAQVYITSALTAIAFSTMLWMNILNARVFFGVRSGPRVVVGSILGIAGIVTLFLPEVANLSWSDATFYGASLCVLAAFIASLGNMVSQGAQKDGLPIIQSNAWGMLYGALFTGAIAVLQARAFNFDWSAGYVISLLYLAVFGSIVAFGAYLTLLGRIGAHRAAYAVVMFPVVALVLSFAFEGLQPTFNVLAGVLLVMGGNVVILQRTPATLPPVDPLAVPGDPAMAGPETSRTTT